MYMCLSTKEATNTDYKTSEPSSVAEGSFPDDFLWGTATASYQVEGSAYADGRGESIWDEFSHRNPSPIRDGSSGDDACKSYELYKRDVQLCVELGVKFYRFSLSWSRILPDGTPKNINKKGIEYYNSLIDELLRNGIQPMVTLFHFDLPQALQEKGGWMNEDIIGWFTDYAKVCFEQFGDRVKRWLTINEPTPYMDFAHHVGILAPGLKGQNFYIGGHYMIKAHAKTWKLYDREFRKAQNGMVGITLHSIMALPLTQSQEDINAAERAMEFQFGWIASPIYSPTGDYPPIMREMIDIKSKEAGLATSQLPYFTKEEIQEIKGSSDFFGLNHYTSRLVSHSEGQNLGDFLTYVDESWPKSGCEWLRPYPRGLRLLLNWIKKSYGNPAVIITESGFCDTTGELQDSGRVEYCKTYLSEILKAINVDKCNVKGYTAWSLMDNFEWTSGYTETFGIHHVDFEDPSRRRTPKDSAKYLQQIFKTNRITS